MRAKKSKYPAEISIHAPAKGATVRDGDSFSEIIISIHAPAKGATRTVTDEQLADVFQSTLPRRERLRIRIQNNIARDFNPRSREGSDFRVIVWDHSAISFQSTLPRRERPTYQPVTQAIPSISIHAPAKGATITCFSPLIVFIFQSTLPRRERPYSV